MALRLDSLESLPTFTLNGLQRSKEEPSTSLRRGVLDSLLAQKGKRGIKKKEHREVIQDAYNRLAFFCPRCEKRIPPPMGNVHSPVVEDYVRGVVGEEEGRRRHIEGHYRHRHTDYEPQMRLLERKYGGKRQPYSNEAFSTEAKAIGQRCNEEARRLIVKDGLLAGDASSTKDSG